MPLFDETPRSDDHASREVAAQEQLTDVEPRHHCLTGAGIVGEKEVERLLREEPVIDSFDLVRQWPDGRSFYRREWIEDVSELDSSGFRCQTEGRAVCVEGPTASCNLDDSLQVTVRDEAVGDGAVI